MTMLLESKFFQPRPRQEILVRPRLMEQLSAGLQRADSSVGQHARTLLSAPQPPTSLESLVISLINDLTNLTGHLVLTLDDYHTITSQEIHQIIHYFISHAPDFFHLMVV
jgi:LuxR family maltose regulon positive regulatory protein